MRDHAACETNREKGKERFSTPSLQFHTAGSEGDRWRYIGLLWPKLLFFWSCERKFESRREVIFLNSCFSYPPVGFISPKVLSFAKNILLNKKLNSNIVVVFPV